MDLQAEVRQKNDQLLLQNAILQQYLCARVNNPGFSSFLVTFVAGPFIAGAAIKIAFGSRGSELYRLYRAVLSGWRFRALAGVGA